MISNRDKTEKQVTSDKKHVKMLSKVFNLMISDHSKHMVGPWLIHLVIYVRKHYF